MLRMLISICFCSNLFGVAFVNAGDKKALNVTFKRSDAGTTVTGINQTCADMTVAFTFDLQNMKSDKGAKFTMNLPPKKVTTITKLTAVNPALKYRFSFRYRWRHGRYKAKHDDKYNYALPFAPGKACRVSQGYFGNFSHKKGSPSQYALDFAMPVGTPVYAARDGVVFSTEVRFNEGGASPSFKGKANHVRIMHDDGTYAAYVHLKQNGTAVKVGQRVKRGQLVGYSGNTGWSTMPHLHFDVRRVMDVEGHETILTAFTTNTQVRNYLRSGFTYGNPK